MRACVVAILLAGCRLHFGTVADGSPSSSDALDAPSDGGAPPCVLDLATHCRNSCALRSDRTVWCWGLGNSGQLGDNSTADSAVPVQAGPIPPVAQIASGTLDSYALDTNGNVWAWGANARHEIGDGTLNEANTPVQTFANATSVVAGESHVCALDTSHNLWCWGWNTSGQIGNNTAVDQPTPLQIIGNVAHAYAGGRCTCVIKTDASVWCWGQGGTGELGDGLKIEHAVPTQIPSFDAVELTMGGHHSCARRSNGSVWCWGRNTFGQVGDGTTTEHDVPFQVPGVANAVALYPSGGRRTCARLANGENWCWGEKPFGALGPAAVSNGIETPHHVVELDGSTLLAAASAHTCMRASDGTIACAGVNEKGQLGDNTMVTRATFAPALLSCP